MRLRRWIWLVLVVVLTACDRSPTGFVTLSGAITGLEPGASANLRLERLDANQAPGQGRVINRFRVANGQWEQSNLKLGPGRYGLFPEAKGYVSLSGTRTFQIVDAGGTWYYRHIDFELLRPRDAPTRVGVPLCDKPPAHGGVFVLPEGTPTPTPTFTPVITSSVPISTSTWPPGTCYAGHFFAYDIGWVGLHGVVSGLPPGQVATIRIYVLPPTPGENYAIGPAPPLDRSWVYPDTLTQVTTPPTIMSEWPLTATLAVKNGPWGLLDPALVGRKYLAIAQTPRQVANPLGYKVVVFAGKVLAPTGGVDFAFSSR